ncbi:phage tail length tape measure family protein [Bradyrhizobium sp. STM 3561]|uniref:phage tail length tape measure family protein n=1 Tax=Bradyrhizobium sp. STM 3561 TaxID=578923 RepID=UPI00388D1467
MADDTDQLVISISADTSQIDRAINRLLGTVNSSTRGIETAFTRTGAAMDGVGISATKLQQQINALTGINTSMKSRAADVEAYGAQLDILRAKYNPLFALSKQYETELDGINKAAKVGAITSAEQAAAIDDLNDRYTSAQTGVKGLTSSHTGLSAQAMAAQHSVRSLVEQLALGIPPSQALTGQLNHLSFAASGPGGLGGAFKDAAKPLAGLLSTSVLTFAGIAASVGGAALAVNKYLSAQEKVQTSLLGAGRASGATAGSINSAAGAGASAFGLSVAEARDLASALAATGKVASEDILPIVKMGHDIAIAFGTDAKGATELLAKAFSDPVAGADQLNQRLGFLDAATKQNITNLVAQNKQFQASQVLINSVKSSVEDFANVESAAAKGWTAIGNAASNAFDSVGQFFAKTLGLGRSLEEQLSEAKNKLDELKSTGGNTLNFETGLGVFGNNIRAIADQQAVVDKLSRAYENMASASARAQAAQQSFVQQSTIRNLTPEIAQQETLNNQLKVMTGLFDQLSSSEGAGETLRQLGLTFEQISVAIKKAQTAVISFKTDYQQALDAQKIQLQSITAFSPSAKGDVAYQETYNASLRQYQDNTKAATLAEGARAIAIKQATTALSEQARAQILSSRQAIDTAQLDITLVGKSVEQQSLLRANLAARQQLEQTASQTRTAFNEAEYQQLVKNNAEAAKRVQVAAQLTAQDNANFSVQTAFLSDVDQQVASVQRQLHGNAWPEFMNDGLAATMRVADALKGISSALSNDLTSGLTDIVSGTKTAKDGFSSMAAAIIKDIEQMIIKLYIVAPLIKSIGGGFSSLGIGESAGASAQAASASTLANNTGGAFFGPGFDGGGYTGPGGKYQPAGIVHKGEFVFDQDAVNRIGVGNLTRLQRGYGSGGYVGMPSVPTTMGHGDGGGEITINNYGDNQVTAQKTPNGGTMISIRKMVDQAVGDSMSSGTGRRVLSNQYGVKQFMGS